MAEEVFLAVLVTRGRKTGQEHAVELKAVKHADSIYFSRHKPDADWYLNAAANPSVVIMYRDGSKISGRARIVTDRALLQRISAIKYPGQARAKDKRVAIEVSPD